MHGLVILEDGNGRRHFLLS